MRGGRNTDHTQYQRIIPVLFAFFTNYERNWDVSPTAGQEIDLSRAMPVLRQQLHAGASIGVDFAAQLNLFKFRFRPVHT